MSPGSAYTRGGHLILNTITSRKAVIKGKLIFYIIVELEDTRGEHTRVTMDIEKGAGLIELHNELHSLTQRVLSA
jgi:hypothetical protein